MPISTLPSYATPAIHGWLFAGTWTAAERAIIERVLRERIPNVRRAQADPWLFLRWEGAGSADRYYAHCPVLHPAGVGYGGATVEDLADDLWEYYFTLHLGPLRWAVADLPEPPAAPDPAPAGNQDDLVQRMVDSQHHAQHGLALLRDGDAVAAQRELALALSLYDHGPFGIGIITALGDAESLLGKDDAARERYMQALRIAEHVLQDRWLQADMRVRLAWCAMRQDRLDAAHAQITAALRDCESASATARSGKSALNRLTATVLATAADIAFRLGQFDQALALVEQAVQLTSRLRQDYGAIARTLTALAWLVYQHDEASMARKLAHRALDALNHWVGVDAAHLRPLRTTLAIMLGPQREPPQSPQPTVHLPANLLDQALAAVRGMDDWYAQALALIELAPHLRPGQLRLPQHDIHALTDPDLPDLYPALVQAVTAHALPEPQRRAALAAVPQRLRVDATTLRMGDHDARYARILLWIGHHLDPAGAADVRRLIAERAAAWHAVLTSTWHAEVQVGAIEGLSVLLPALPPAERAAIANAIEAALLEALRAPSYYPRAFAAALPTLARIGAGWQVYEYLAQQERLRVDMAISMLAFIAEGDTRRAAVESILRSFEERTVIAATTELAADLVRLAPSLDRVAAQRAIGVATSVRAIMPRVRALVALARALPDEERHTIHSQAYAAAQRSKSKNIRGEALAAIVTGIQQPPFTRTIDSESR